MDVSAIRDGLDHPVIDGDGHTIEYLPLLRQFVAEEAGDSVASASGAGRERARRLALPVPRISMSRLMAAIRNGTKAPGTTRSERLTLGWQRVVPVALLGFLAAQWVQQARQRDIVDRSM